MEDAWVTVMDGEITRLEWGREGWLVLIAEENPLSESCAKKSLHNSNYVYLRLHEVAPCIYDFDSKHEPYCGLMENGAH